MEYFVRTVSFPAPLVGDEKLEYVKAESPQSALEIALKRYAHPAKLHTASVYANADSWHKGQRPLVVWSHFA